MRSIKITFNLCGDMDNIIFIRNCMKDASEKPQPIQWVMCLVQCPCVSGDMRHWASVSESCVDLVKASA